ncbi:MAG: SprB repeat-containing protein [Marinilabilia sp.]
MVPIEGSDPLRYSSSYETIKFSKSEIDNDEIGKSKDKSTVNLTIYRKAEIKDFSPTTFCVNNQDNLNVSLKSDVDIGDVSGNIIIEKLNDGEGEKYSTGVGSLSKNIPVSDIHDNYDIPYGRELQVRFENEYFNIYEENEEISSQRGLYILEPPPYMDISVPEIQCHGEEAGSITIENIPYTSEENQLRIDLIKYFDKSFTIQDHGNVQNEVIDGDTLYWSNQTITESTISPGQSSITFDKSQLTDEYMDFKSGYYKIEAFYLDGSASSFCSNDTIIYIDEPDPLELNLDVENFTTTGGGSTYQIPENGDEVTISGSVIGNQEPYTIYYEDKDENQNEFELDDTLLSEGNYTFWVEDDECVSNDTTLTLDEPDPLMVDTTVYSPVCHPDNSGDETKYTGSINFKIDSGGIPNFYAKLIDNGNNDTTTISGINRSDKREIKKLDPGTYTLKIWDNGDPEREDAAVFSENYTITEPSKMTLESTPTDVSCNGNSDGEMTLDVKNGTPSFSYSISENRSSGNFSGNKRTHTINDRSPNDYTVTVTDDNGCKVTQEGISIEEPDLLQISKTDSSPDTCELEIGSLTFEISGGWSEEKNLVVLSSSDSQPDTSIIEAGANNRTATFDNLSAGTDYEVSVSNGDCSTSLDNITVEETNPLDNLSISQTVKESCNGAENAELEIENTDSIKGPFDVYLNSTKYENHDGHQIKGLAAQDDAYIRVKETDEDGRGCVYDTTMNIKVLADSVDFNSPTVTPASCNTASDGSINVEGAGGPDGGYKYKIDDQNYTEEYKSQSRLFDGLFPGTYTVSVKDTSGCEISEDITVEHNENPVSVDTIIVDPALCANASDGAITVKNIQYEDEGVMEFLWNGTPVDSIGSMEELSFKGPDESGLSPGTYSLKFTDDNNCSFEETIEVGHEGYQPDFSQSIEEAVACPGKDNGRVSFELDDGQADDFEYKVFEGKGLNGLPLKTGESKTDTLFRIEGLTNKEYSVQVTDSNGCGDTLEVDMPVIENPLEISEKNITPASCDEIGNGVLEVTAEGGYPLEDDRYIFSYEKTPSNGSDKIAGSDTTDVWKFDSLFRGDNIDFSVKDKYGCTVDGDLVTVDVKDDFTEIQDVITTHPACHNDSTGKLVPGMQWTPGSTDYNYFLYAVDDSFNYADTVSGGLREDDLAIDGLPAGNYELEVVDDDGCRDIYKGLNLKDPDPVSVAVDHNYIRAKDEETGRFELTITGGNQKYEVGWAPKPGEDILSDVDTITSSSFQIEDLPGGSYRVAVRDTANCPYFEGESWFTREITIPEPEKPLNLSSDTVIDVSCNKLSDGRVEVEAEGGWGPGYMYSLNGGEPQDSAVFDRLKAGEYSVLVTDTAGGSDSLSLEVTQPDTLNVFVDEVRDATCPRYANGVVEATVLNGIKGEDGLRYFVEDTAGQSEIHREAYSDRSYQFDRLPKGNYEIFVEDANGCVASKPFSVQEPDTAVISIDNNYIRAKGDSTGTISASVKHGNGVFDYRWFYEDDDGPFEKDTTHGNIELDSLAGGEYTLMVRDTAGCVYEEDEWMERHIDIREPGKPLGFDVAENRAVSCYGEEDGLLRIAPDGGWGDYRLRLGDGKFVSSPVFDGLGNNKYAISVKDSAGIVYSDSIEVTQPDSLQVTVSSTDDVNCYKGSDGAINLEISGGNLSYLVSPDGEEWHKGTTVDGLTKGSYSAHVKDTVGCSLVLEPVEINQPDEIVLSDSSIVESRCGNNEGAIEAEYEGGVGDYSYQWFKVVSKDEGQQEQMLKEDENRRNIDELYAGRYQAVVTDEHDCQRSFEYRVGDIADLTIDSIRTNGVVCAGDSNGSAEAFVSKGNPAYSYAWSDEVGTSDQEEAGEIPAGQHWLEVSDEKGCLVFRDFTIETPEPLTYDTLSLKQPLCLGGEKGRIELEGKGGTPGYEYRWSDGASGTVREVVEPGAYEFTLIDSRDCRARFSLDMDWQRELQPDIGRDTTICHYDVLTLDGGDYKSYKWSLGDEDMGTSRRLETDNPGLYSLRVRDEDQCLGFDTLSLDVSTLEIRDIETTAVSCANAGDGRAEISIASNGDDYSISWPDDSEENVWENIPGGNYRVKVDNPHGCIAERDFTIDEPDPLSLTTSLRNPLCHGVHDGRIQVSASGGNGSYSYRWQHGPEQSSLRGLDEGEYILAVTDAKGCTLSDRYELSYQRTLQPDLGADLDLCSEATAYVTPGRFHAYKWSRDGEEVEGDSLLEVDGPGDYVVEVSDEDGCLAFDSLQVSGILSDLFPQFLSASAIPKGDTLMVVDVTTPKPSVLEWSFSGKYEIIDEGDYFCEVVFEDEGMHTATLNASLDRCMGMSRKQILVTPEDDQNNPENTDKEGGSSLFNSMTVAPNPTEGAFTVELEMKETATVNLYLVRIETGQIYEQKQLSGLDDYRESFNVSGSGRYVLFAECMGDRLMRKVLVR